MRGFVTFQLADCVFPKKQAKQLETQIKLLRRVGGDVAVAAAPLGRPRLLTLSRGSTTPFIAGEVAVAIRRLFGLQ
jgi:hypothetical protein